jgi:hypothetical protein
MLWAPTGQTRLGRTARDVIENRSSRAVRDRPGRQCCSPPRRWVASKLDITGDIDGTVPRAG